MTDELEHGLTFKSFLHSTIDEPRSASAEAARKLFLTWSPYMAIVVVLTSPMSILGVAAKCLIAVTILAERYRLRNMSSFLNLWKGRVALMLLSYVWLALWIADKDVYWLLFLPLAIVGGLVYFQYNYMKWRVRHEAT